MAAIFISHSSKDNALAAEVKLWLARQGYEQVFLDFDKDTGVGAGRFWERELYEAIERCHAMLVVVTPAWLDSKWCFAELSQAKALGKAIYPIILTAEDTTIIGPELQALQAAAWDADGQEQLSQQLQDIASELARGHRWDRTRPPWPGIFAFEEEDAAVFFGRDPEVRRVVEVLEARRALGGARLVLVIGASGSGKSSLMRAGVLPLLARDPGRWLVLPSFRPSGSPMTALAKTLAETVHHPSEWEALRDKLTSAEAREALGGVLDELRVGASRDATVVLPIDQFEEAFVLTEVAERTRFIQLLRVAVDRERPLPLLTLATVRSDLLGQMLATQEFDAPHQACTLGPLPRERVAAVIEGPARVAGIGLEHGLVERIVDDVGDCTALPLLAFALRELYERYGLDKRLDLREYTELGDVSLGLGPLANAVRRKAEDALVATAPTDEERRALKEAFVGNLVRISDGGTPVRRTAPLSDLPVDARRLIERLVEARILTASGSGTERVVEVAHEALFTAWPQLATWLTEEEEFLNGQRQLEAADALWQEAKPAEKPRALLTGLLLERARQWTKDHPHRLAIVREFVSQSIDAHRTQEEDERRRLEEEASRERAHAAKLSESLKAADAARELAERRRGQAETARRRARQRTVAASLVAVVAICAGLYAQQLSKKARLAAAEAALKESIRLGPENGREALAQASLALRQAPHHVAARTHLTLLLQAVPRSVALRHEAAVSALAFSPNGTRLVTASFDRTVRRWNAATGSPIGDPLSQGVPVADIAVSNRRIATTSRADNARLWDLATGSSIGEPLTHEGAIVGMVFSPDGSQIATASRDKTVRLWDATTGSPSGSPLTHDAPVSALAFSPDGGMIVTASEFGLVRLWETRAGTPIGELTSRPIDAIIGALIFSPDGTTLALIEETRGFSRGGIAHLWSAPSLSSIGAPMAHEAHVEALAFSPDGTRVATAAGKTTRHWDAASGSPVGEPLLHDHRIVDVAFSSEGTRFATLGEGEVRLWDATRPGPSKAAIGGPLVHNDVLSAVWRDTGGFRAFGMPSSGNTGLDTVVFSPTGTRLATASGDAAARLWSTATRSPIGLPLGKPVESVAFSPDGTTVVTAEGEIARLWDAATGAAVGEPLAHDTRIDRAVFSPDSARLATWGDRHVYVWDLAGGTRRGVSLAHDSPVLAAGFGPDGRTITTTSRGNGWRLWDTATGAPVGELDAPHEDIRTAAFSIDGRRLVTATNTATLVRDAASGSLVGEPLGHDSVVTAITLSPDGTKLATATGGALQRWNVATGSPIGEPLEHGPAIELVALGPNGDRVATAGGNTARLWDTATDAPVGEPMLLDEPIDYVSFSRDGTRLATAGASAVYLWNTANGSLIGVPLPQQDAWGVAFSPDGTRIATAGQIGRLWAVDVGYTDALALADLATASSGMRALETGTYERASDTAALRERVTIGASRALVEWGLGDPQTRPIWPSSRFRVADYVWHETLEGRGYEADDAFPLQPVVRRCAARPARGPCKAAMPRYYFDDYECRDFMWGGCGGAAPFETLEHCQQACLPLLAYTLAATLADVLSRE